jgi:hypothetical protein
MVSSYSAPLRDCRTVLYVYSMVVSPVAVSFRYPLTLLITCARVAELESNIMVVDISDKNEKFATSPVSSR